MPVRTHDVPREVSIGVLCEVQIGSILRGTLQSPQGVLTGSPLRGIWEVPIGTSHRGTS